MAITFTCNCGRSVQVGDEHAGQQGKCPSCGRTVVIPNMHGTITERDAMHRAPPPLPTEIKKKPVWEKELPTKPPNQAPDSVDDLGSVVTHAGPPIQEDDDFFAEAPKEIGRLFSVFTSLKTDIAPTPAGTRAIYAGIAFVLGFVASAFVVAMFQGGRMQGDGVAYMLLVGFAVGGFLVGIVYWLTGFQHTCSFVGDDGVASFQCTGDRTNVTQGDLFLFRDAVELRIAQTRQYVNGGYTGTNYSFTWSNDRGNSVFALSGRYSSEEGTPVFSDPYYYALSAESSWSLHLFRNIDRMTTLDQLLFFGLTGGNHIQVGNGIFILTQGGSEIELQSDQISKMTIENGVISVWEHGGKQGWFSNTGIHQFNYADVANARFFMFALDKCLGIRL